MSPFIDDDSYEDDYCLNLQKEKKTLSKHDDCEDQRKRWFSFSINEDKKFFLIGVLASVVVFVGIIYFMYSNSKPTNIEDLPVIKPIVTPIKIKPDFNEQVQHQDKVVYDNISGNNSKSTQVVVDNQNYTSNKKIIQKIDDFSNNSDKLVVKSTEVDGNDSDNSQENNQSQQTSEKKYSKKENVIPNLSEHSVKDTLVIKEQLKSTKTTNIPKNIAKRKADAADKKILLPSNKSTIFVQIASLNSKIDADKEYNRVVRKLPKIKKFDKNVVKIDLGKNKGIKYKLKIGPFSTKQNAIFYINLLREVGITSYISK